MGNVGKDSAHVSAVVSKQTKAFLEAYASAADINSAGKLVKRILGAWESGEYYSLGDRDAECRAKAADAVKTSGFSSRSQPEAPKKASPTAQKRRRAS
jgi:hypothetical protein